MIFGEKYAGGLGTRVSLPRLSHLLPGCMTENFRGALVRIWRTTRQEGTTHSHPIGLPKTCDKNPLITVESDVFSDE